MAPRKSAASTTSAALQSPNGPGDVSLLSTTSTMASEHKSSTIQKANRQSNGGDADGEKSEKHKPKHDDIGIDDLLLPRTLTSRLSRGVLPPNTSIQRDALLALTKSATVFISYLGHTANGLTSRKTIQSQDILEALRETELWNVPISGAGGGRGGMTLGERVQAEVEKWEDEVKGKRKGYRERVKARESGGIPDAGNGEAEEQEGQTRGPIAKKARRGSETNVDISMQGEGDDLDNSASQPRDGPSSKNDETIDTEQESADDAEEDVEVEADDDQGAADEDEEDEDEVDDEVEGEEGEDSRIDEDGDDDTMDQDEDDDAATRQRTRLALAPNGRVEVGSDEESD